MTSTSAVFDQALGPIAALSSGFQESLSTATDDEVGETLRQVEEFGRLVDSLRVVSAAEIADRSRHDLGTDGMAYKLGCTKPAHLIERVTLVAQKEASRRMRLGAAIRPTVSLSGEVLPAEFPAVAVALSDGGIGLDSAHHIIKYLGDARRTAQPDDLTEAEEMAVEFARTHSADLVKDLLIALRELLDPDGIEPRDAEARALRSFWIREDRDGMTIFGGKCSPTVAGLIRAALAEGGNPKAQPRFLPEEELAAAETTEIIDEDGTVHIKVIDPRTREQRQHDIIIGTLTAGLRNADKKSTSLRPLTAVMVTVTLDDLQNGTGAGWIDDVTEPVAASTVEQMVCDGGATPIVLGKNGEVLYLGTPVRLFSVAQRKALAVRDGGCVWPGCTAPPSWCEAHHVIEHKKGGPTDIDNGVLLCSAHHHMLHASEFFMKMIDGKPRLLAPAWLDPGQSWQPVGRTRALLRL
ncbi:HNH endonuclease signature motif containing protein [soil metagenome]